MFFSQGNSFNVNIAVCRTIESQPVTLAESQGHLESYPYAAL